MGKRWEVRLERSWEGLGVHSVVYSLRDPRLYQDNENSALCPALRSQVALTEK